MAFYILHVNTLGSCHDSTFPIPLCYGDRQISFLSSRNINYLFFPYSCNAMNHIPQSLFLKPHQSRDEIIIDLSPEEKPQPTLCPSLLHTCSGTLVTQCFSTSLQCSSLSSLRGRRTIAEHDNNTQAATEVTSTALPAYL